MSELFGRQAALLRQLIHDYRIGNISLDTLIQEIEAVSDVIGTDAWDGAISQIVWSMEQIHAALIEGRRSLTPEESASIGGSLLDLGKISEQLEANCFNH